MKKFLLTISFIAGLVFVSMAQAEGFNDVVSYNITTMEYREKAKKEKVFEGSNLDAVKKEAAEWVRQNNVDVAEVEVAGHSSFLWLNEAHTITFFYYEN